MIDVCCAIIELPTQSGTLVLAARKGKPSHLAGLWEFPGGKLEPNESAEDAIVREIQEELACSIAIVRPLTPVCHDYGTHAIRLIPFVCSLTHTLPTCKEHAALAFLRREQLQALPWAPADQPILAEYLR
jgi:8-oxo-dGTP diphosphatase